MKVLAQELLGCEVLNLAQGETIGTVVDFALTRDGRVAQVGVLPARWYEGGLGLPPAAAAPQRDERICLRDASCLSAFAADGREVFSAKSHGLLAGKTVLQQDGGRLGVLADFAFNPADGRIEDVIVLDPDGKRTRIAVAAFRACGRDYLVIERAPVAAGAAAQRAPAPEPAEPARGPAWIEEQAAPCDAAPAAAASSVFDRKKCDFLRGRQTRRDLVSREGGLLVAKGGVLDDAALGRIISAGLLSEVFIELTLNK